MTMPTLIADHQKKETSVRLKKFYSIMSQAILLSENDNGPSNDWDKAAANRDEDGVLIDDPDASIKFLEKYLVPYMKFISLGKDADGNAEATLVDGSVISLLYGNCVDITFDTNGKKRPNQLGRDKFRFLLCQGEFATEYIDYNKSFGTYFEHQIISRGRDYAKESCRTARHTCATLLLMDDWEVKDDYPW